MAWVAPRTYVAAAVLTAAQLNETRDNLLALRDWIGFTPALTASVTNPTLGTGATAVGSYRFQPSGIFEAEISIVFGTSGVAAGSGNYYVSSLPVGLNPVSTAIPIGAGRILDSSAGTVAICQAFYDTSTRVALTMMSTTALAGFGTVTNAAPMAWAASDRIDLTLKTRTP